MKTIADMKREMVVGSRWHCVNHVFGRDFGIREVSSNSSTYVKFWSTDKEGKRCESGLPWPKKDDVVFEGDKVHVYCNDCDNDPMRLILTYTKVI